MSQEHPIGRQYRGQFYGNKGDRRVNRFAHFLATAWAGIEALVGSDWPDVRGAALRDAGAFVTKAEEDLRLWTTLLAEEKLTRQDFEALVRGKKDLAELGALKQLGLAAARLDRFREGLIVVVIGSAVRTFL